MPEGAAGAHLGGIRDRTQAPVRPPKARLGLRFAITGRWSNTLGGDTELVGAKVRSALAANVDVGRIRAGLVTLVMREIKQDLDE